MIDAPFTLAFTAGLVATVNPCGFAMLPAYLSYFMGLSDDGVETGGPAAVRRALVIGAVVSSGFLLVFGLVGVLVTLGLRAVIDVIPWAVMVIGAGVRILGIAMLLGYEPVVNLPKIGGARSGKRSSAVHSVVDAGFGRPGRGAPRLGSVIGHGWLSAAVDRAAGFAS